MKLQEASIKWAIKHLYKENDTDLFPRPYELDIINDMEQEVIDACKEIEITTYKWNPARRFIIPKDNLSYRNATQLDLIDSIILGAIIYEFGHLIEKKRIPEAENTVFSYRFKPEPDGTLYANKHAWTDFWTKSKEKAKFFDYILLCDISDFYNQIYLHTIENQLGDCGFQNQVIKRINELLISVTQRSSKGIPIGPHVMHLLAEMSLIPFDNQMKFRSIPYKRYVDDMIFFCESEKKARIRINEIAEALDKEQRLVLQNQKTEILTKKEFIALCERKLMEKPTNEIEKELMGVIQSYSDGNSYAKIKLDEITDDDLKVLSKEKFEALLNFYLKEERPNYERIRWIYRRLSQLGLPVAVEFSISNFERLIPALNDVCLYINSCSGINTTNWKQVGNDILEILNDEIVQSNEFYRISLLNLFVYNKDLNHINKLVELFNSSSSNVKRKILLAVSHYKESNGWLNNLKEQYNMFDSWTKRAYLIAAQNLPRESRSYFFKGVKPTLDNSDILEKVIMNWAEM